MACSSTDSKIYVTDKCTKAVQNLVQTVEEMGLQDTIMNSPTIIYNDNEACICWAHNLTTKGLGHIQIRENAVREAVQANQVEVKYIAGAVNLSDMFTKEEKDTSHFLQLQDRVLEVSPEKENLISSRSSQ
eukprot:11884780-Ditylum_brightwellii.AAC.1